jgi:hypothetical protein
MSLFLPLQAGVEFIISWAVSNSDPANLILLAVVYFKLSRNHSDLADKVDRLQSCLDDMNGVSDSED